MTTASNHTATDTPVDQAWVTAEEHILKRIASLTMWEAERWAAAHERQLGQISLMELRVSYLYAAGESHEADYLRLAFSRIEAAIAGLEWAPCSTGEHDDTDRIMALSETVGAVTAVARHALTAVVLADEAELASF